MNEFDEGDTVTYDWNSELFIITQVLYNGGRYKLESIDNEDSEPIYAKEEDIQLIRKLGV